MDIDISDSDESLELDFENNANMYNNLEFKYFPEPYCYLGQFIISSLVGTYITYLSKKTKDNIDFDKCSSFIDLYYNYCSTIIQDKNSNDMYNCLFIRSFKV
jgi:hypothetical protein